MVSHAPHRPEMASYPPRGRRDGLRTTTEAEAWARRLQRGEPDAIGEVRLRVARIIGHKGLRIPAQDRDDLEQEIMVQVWQAVNRPTFDLTAGFWGFVETVTARRCIDWLRTRVEGGPIAEDLEAQTAGPLRQALEREKGELAEEVLKALPPPCRQLITLRASEGLSFGEIAGIVGKSEGALRVQLYRCIQQARKLRQRIAKGLGSGAGDSEAP